MNTAKDFKPNVCLKKNARGGGNQEPSGKRKNNSLNRFDFTLMINSQMIYRDLYYKEREIGLREIHTFYRHNN